GRPSPTPTGRSLRRSSSARESWPSASRPTSRATGTRGGMTASRRRRWPAWSERSARERPHTPGITDAPPRGTDPHAPPTSLTGRARGSGVVLAVVVIKWLFILALVAALCWVILFFVHRVA